MGKGTNATHINEGLYTIDYQYDTDAITARIATLTTRLAELNSEQVSITSDIKTREFDIASIEDTIDQNIDDLNDLKSDLDEANERLNEIPDEITEQEDLLAPIDARMLVIAIFLSPIQSSIASKQAALAEATDPDVIAQLTSEIEALQEQETILSDEYDDLNVQKTPITTAISDLETEQSTLQETVPTLEDQITTLRDTKHPNESNLSNYRADLLQLEVDLASTKLQIASTQKSIDALSAIPASVPGTYVWCADFTEDLSGEVGIMEVAGFEDSGINIQPGWVDPDSGAASPAVYDSDRDGITVPAEATSGAQAFWNRAMQGGWQKWRPTFRWGTITVIDHDADTCSLTMSVAANPDTGLDVNKMATLSNVPIEYMSCNSAPFAVGDTVVVKFTGQSWDDPVVIGFTSEPKPCAWESWNGPEISSENPWVLYVDPYHFGSPITATIQDGHMTLDASGVTYGGSQSFLYCNIDPALDCNRVKVKCTAASSTGTDFGQGVWMRLPSDADDIYLFAGGTIWDTDFHQLGVGEWTIELDTDDITLPLDYIGFEIRGTGTLTIDYIEIYSE